LLSQLKEEKELDKAKKKFLNACDKILTVIEEGEDKISRYASKIIKNHDKIFTHCHSSTVEKALILAREKGKIFEVYNTETRPLYQGRITAKNLLKAGINVTMVIDSSAGFLISKYSGKELMMTKVLIGCDAILKDGSVINKIGSFGIGLSAFYEKVPLYVAASLLKFTPISWIKIEERSPKEIWRNAPKGLKIINFAFDIVPPKFIKGIICEKGLITPNQVKSAIIETYPWVFKNFHILH
jgi:ribose 1,5-bisphosphate isomerase